MFCSKCGKEVHDDAVVCIHCGCAIKQGGSSNNGDERNWLVTLLLCLFLGCLGVHRFYTGHIGIGVAQLLTCGGCGIWSFIDFICICCRAYKDADGNPLV